MFSHHHTHSSLELSPAAFVIWTPGCQCGRQCTKSCPWGSRGLHLHSTIILLPFTTAVRFQIQVKSMVNFTFSLAILNTYEPLIFRLQNEITVVPIFFCYFLESKDKGKIESESGVNVLLFRCHFQFQNHVCAQFTPSLSTLEYHEKPWVMCWCNLECVRDMICSSR